MQRTSFAKWSMQRFVTLHNFDPGCVISNSNPSYRYLSHKYEDY